jgi:hypothetical protein
LSNFGIKLKEWRQRMLSSSWSTLSRDFPSVASRKVACTVWEMEKKYSHPIMNARTKTIKNGKRVVLRRRGTCTSSVMTLLFARGVSSQHFFSS